MTDESHHRLVRAVAVAVVVVLVVESAAQREGAGHQLALTPGQPARCPGVAAGVSMLLTLVHTAPHQNTLSSQLAARYRLRLG